jgi:hypothetical protein
MSSTPDIMRSDSQPRIIYAERLGDGVIVAFEDGKTAIYSSSLLRSFFSQAQELPPEDRKS